MRVELKKQAEQDLRYFKKNAPEKIERIKKLIRDIEQTAYSGLGKPEPLKFGLAGYWSRRIDREHRLVYKVEDHTLIILQCRYHYD